ncbi:hypothetical protein Tco_1492622 [Tanacetum coccineum]
MLSYLLVESLERRWLLEGSLVRLEVVVVGESNHNGIFEFEFIRERASSVATNARQSKGKFHVIFSTTSFTSPGSMLLNLDQLEKQLDKEEFQETGSMDAFRVLKTQFQLFINLQYYFDDDDGLMIRKYFLAYTQTEGKVDSSKALDASLVVTESSGTESDKQDTSSRSGNDTDALDADIRLVSNEEPRAESSKVQSRKSRNNIKPVEKRPNVNKPERWISKGYRLSPDKSFAVRKKPNTPGSCLRWKSTGRIFKTASLRWISTGKMFTDSPTKCRNQGFKEFKSDDHEQRRLLATLQAPLLKEKKGVRFSALYLKKKRNLLYFKPPPNVDHLVPEVPAPVPAASTSSPSSTTVDQDAPSTKPSSDETTLQGVIPSNLHHPNQSFDTLTKLKKNHTQENVISDPSRPVSTRSQLQEHAIWCYFDANDNPIPFGRKQSG